MWNGAIGRRYVPSAHRPPLAHDAGGRRATGARRGRAAAATGGRSAPPLRRRTDRRLHRAGAPRLPLAAAAPPSDMPLALGVPGHGWKATCIDTTQPAALAWAPLALPVILANQAPALQRRIWPSIQRSLRIAEAPIPAPGQDWRSYSLEWQADGARFSIDNRIIFTTERAPRGPLGFVAWVDNQWMVATPRGRFGWGLLDTPAQWMDLASVRIESLERY